MMKLNQNLAYLYLRTQNIAKDVVFHALNIHFDEINVAMSKFLHNRRNTIYIYLNLGQIFVWLMNGRERCMSWICRRIKRGCTVSSTNAVRVKLEQRRKVLPLYPLPKVRSD
jgi:hypothetical protein